LVTLQGRRLTIFVNGRALRDSIPLEHTPRRGGVGIGVWKRDASEVRAEFTRFALWQLPE
jgi:hypothetical protein